eukprot:COSAG02_NODE_54767_length_294_cov_0.800000_1_plen_31_part_10
MRLVIPANPECQTEQYPEADDADKNSDVRGY